MDFEKAQSTELVFTAELAGVPIRVRCRREESRAFLSDYLSEREPAFTVAPAEEDLQRVRLGLEQMAEREGSRRRFSDSYLENNAIHALAAEGLLAYDVLLLHGSALCMDGNAFVFTAPSGTGKSTQARLWREAFGERVWMINDDKPLLRVEKDRVTVWGSPWDGKHHLSRNASAPLKAVFLVERCAENRLETLPKADALQTLMQQCYRSDKPMNALRVLTLEKRILETVSFYRLRCNMEREAALVAWEGVSG